MADPLRALFPALYSRRSSPCQDVWTRDWWALRMPRLRLMGPNWSVAALPRETPYLPRKLSLDVLSDGEMPEELESGADRLHRPTAVRALLRGLFPWEGEPGSRSSLIAVHFDDAEPHFRRPLDPDDADPDGTKIGGIDRGRSTELVLEPFGVVPENAVDVAGSPDPLFLPAARLVAGQIWFRPRNGYLAAMRERLGLEAPVDLGETDRLVLLPDGVGIAGRLSLPWQADPVSAWFKLTSARAGAADLDALRIWEEGPSPDGGSSTAATLRWQAAVDALEEILAETGRNAGGPAWFSLRAAAGLRARDLAWPCRQGPRDVLLWRRAGDPVRILGEKTVAQLGPRGDQGGSRLTLRLAGLDMMAGGGGSLVLRNPADAPAPQGLAPESRTDAAYTFDGPGAETLTLGVEAGAENPRTRLAVPMLSTAARLRTAMGFPTPGREDPPETSGRLWLFTPLSRGWLHWAMPNVTVPDFVEFRPAQSDGPPETEAASAGAWSLAPPEVPRSRPWQIDLSDAAEARVSVRLEEAGDGWRVASAEADLTGVSLGMRGLLPVTGFAQTPERMLPETAERALFAEAIDAVTPDLLTGLERDVWQQSATDGGLKVEATVEGMKLKPVPGGTGAQIDGKPRVTVDVTWPDARQPGSDRFGAKGGPTQPWVWLRHPDLPTVQTLPRAATGAAAGLPSSLRELAPLRPVSEDPKVSLTFADLRLDAEAVALDLASLGPLARPESGSGWIDEIGMTVATLPSLTLFPGEPEGQRPGPAGAHWGAPDWAAGHMLAAEIRHDIALTDEGYGLAKLPPPDPEDSDATDRPAGSETLVFAPLPYNAPGGGDMPSPWRPVWAEQARTLALSAAEDRELIRADANAQSRLALGGVLSDLTRSLAASDLTVDLSLAIAEADGEGGTYEPGTGGRRLLRAGRLALSANATGGSAQDWSGLPATGDLMGLSGTVAGFGAETVEVLRGTLSAVHDPEQSLSDQGGWAVRAGDSGEDDALIRRRLRRRRTAFEDGEETDLVSLVRGLELDGAGGVTAVFHLRDVPMRPAGAGSGADRPHQTSVDLDKAWYGAEGLDGAANAAQAERNALSGFSWSLQRPTVAEETGDDALATAGLVPLGPFLFHPLALTAVALGPDPGETHHDAVAMRVEIAGRILLPPTETEGAAQPVPGDGAAKLILEAPVLAPDARLSWQLELSDLWLPLAGPSGGPQPDVHSPVLTATALHVRADGWSLPDDAKAELVVRVGDSRVARPLTTPGGDTPFCFADTGEGLPGTGEIGLAHATVALDPVPHGPVPSAVPTVAVRLRGALPLDGAVLDLNEPLPLGLDGGDTEPGASTLRIGSGADLPVAVTNLRFDDTVLAFDWVAAGQGPEPRILGGFALTEARGATLARLTTSAHNGQTWTAGLTGASLMLKMAADGAGTLRVTHESAPPRRRTVLSGRLDLRNLFAWPSLELDLQSVHHRHPEWVGVPDGGTVSHRAVFAFDAAEIDLAELVAGRLRVAARTRHSLTHSAGVRRWDAHQTVLVTSAARLAEDLQRQLDSAALGVRTGAAARDRLHLAPEAETMVSGLSTGWMKDLQSRLLKAPETAVVDASAHHLLPATRGGQHRRILSHVPLPMLAGLRPWRTDVTPPEPDPFAGLFPSEFPDTTLSRPVDGPPLPDLAAGDRDRLAWRLREAESRAQETETDTPSALLAAGDGRWRRALFQGSTTVDRADETWGDEEAPWADTAMRFGLFLMQDETAEGAGAFALAPEGWTDNEMLAAENVLVTQDPCAGTPGATEEVTVGTRDAYRRTWSDGVLGTASRALLPPPRPPRPESGSRRKGVRVGLYAPRRDGERIGEIGRLDLDTNEAPEPDRLRSWAQDTLARHASWAEAGLVLAWTTGSGAPRLERALSVAARRDPVRRPPHPDRPLTGTWEPQGQRSRAPVLLEEVPETGEVRPAALPVGVARGYLPARIGARTLTSEPGELPLSGQTVLRLTASGAAVAAALAGTTARVLETGDRHYWSSDRETMAFRRWAPATTGDGPPRLALALPPKTAAPLPGALLAGRSGALPADTDLGGATGFLPPVQETTLVGTRAGVWTGRRLGIDALDGGGGRASASESPVWLRTPRPVELGVNDRTRASLYEDTHFALADRPMAMLHGPARAMGPLEVGAEALDRSPRSKDAFLVSLDEIEGGVLPAAWAGTLTLRLEGWFAAEPGSTPPAAAWNVAEALITIGDALYRAEAIEAQRRLALSRRDIRLAGFQRISTTAPGDGAADPTAAEADLRDLPATTEVGLLVLMRRIATGGETALYRRLAFAFRKGGTGAPLSAPAYLRFEDPAFNDRLAGEPEAIKTETLTVGDKPVRLTIAGERKKVRATDYVETVLALRPDSEARFGVVDGAPVLKLGTIVQAIRIDLERRRPSEDGGDPELLELGVWPRPSVSDRLISMPLFLPLCVPPKTPNAKALPVFRAGDQLAVSLTIEGRRFANALLLDLVEHPLNPVNSAAYALLRFREGGTGRTLSAPLYQRGAEPGVIELVDPAELALGRVRRRGHFAWSSFIDAPARTDRYALLKSAGTGASWLPDRLDTDWLHLPGA